MLTLRHIQFCSALQFHVHVCMWYVLFAVLFLKNSDYLLYKILCHIFSCSLQLGTSHRWNYWAKYAMVFFFALVAVSHHVQIQNWKLKSGKNCCIYQGQEFNSQTRQRIGYKWTFDWKDTDVGLRDGKVYLTSCSQ